MEQEFQHSAGAYGLSGDFSAPVAGKINIRPSVDLPPEGGFGTDLEENFNFHNLVTCRRAYTEVSGSPNMEPRGDVTVRAHNNLALTVIDDFNLLHVIEVRKMVSRVTTRYFEGEEHIEIVLPGSRYEGFRIFGQDIIIELATELFYDNPTYSGLQTCYAAGGAPRDRYHKLSGGEKFPEDEDSDIKISLVENIIVPRPTREFTVRGNVIEIPHIGSLTLGTLNISKKYKSLDLLRWNLGCPAVGDGGVGGTRGGGVNPST